MDMSCSPLPAPSRRQLESLRRRAQQRPRGRDTRLDIIIGAGAGPCRGQHGLDAVGSRTSPAPGMVAAAMSAMSGAAMGTAASASPVIGGLTASDGAEVAAVNVSALTVAGGRPQMDTLPARP